MDQLSERIRKMEEKGDELNAVCNTNSLNVRKGPGLFYPLAGELVVGERKNGWARIERPNGWAKEKYLAYAAHV